MQQINLYQIEEAPDPVLFTFRHMAQAAVVCVVFLILASCTMLANYLYSQKEFNALQQKRLALEKELEQTKGKIPLKEEKEQLIQQIKDLETMGTNIKKMQSTLAQLQYVAGAGFSPYLTALAKYNVPELWLTEINISSGGTLIHLAGKTTNAENIPKLLQKLSADANFSGKTFKTFKIFADEKEKCICFSIGATK